MGKVYNGIMGLVVADALGVPVEFKKRDTFHVTDMMGYGTYNQPPGTWSDDSSLTLATLESLGRLKHIDLDDIMGNFVKWLYHNEFTPYGEVFDVGGTTRRAIENYRFLPNVQGCGERTEQSNGNGSLMRILPVAFIKFDFNNVVNISALTHAHGISTEACYLYTLLAQVAIHNVDLKTTIRNLGNWIEVIPPFHRLPILETLTRDEIKSTGYVVDTLEAALWCVLKSNSYRECVLMAVNLGDDTDTVAAVAGGLAGLMYGVGGDKGIPDDWIAQIAKKEWIQALCDTLES